MVHEGFFTFHFTVTEIKRQEVRGKKNKNRSKEIGFEQNRKSF